MASSLPGSARVTEMSIVSVYVLFASCCCTWNGAQAEENYDDQSVESIPSSKNDYQYVDASPPERYEPYSAMRVPPSDPVQEQFTGLHTHENELFRSVEEAPEAFPKGTRVASGLAVDDKGTQFQAHSLTPQEVAAPGVVPLCRTYRNAWMSLTDWGSPSNWITFNEFGIARVSTKKLSPVTEPTTLLLPEHTCNAAALSTNIRLEDKAVAGLVFRAESAANLHAALLDQMKRAVVLKAVKDGTSSIILEKPVSYVHPQMRHELKVVDSGRDGIIQVYLNQKLLLTHSEPYQGMGSMGIQIDQGHAVFDSFTISLSATPNSEMQTPAQSLPGI